jgi:hypothetical protein
MSAKKMSAITECSIFAIGLPLILALIATILGSLMKRPGSPGMDAGRGLIMGIPIGGSAGVLLIFGILLVVTRKAWALVGCVVGGYLIALSYCVVMVILTGTVGVNLITGAMIAVPVLLTIRSGKAFAEIRNGAPSDSQAPPRLPPST